MRMRVAHAAWLQQLMVAAIVEHTSAAGAVQIAVIATGSIVTCSHLEMTRECGTVASAPRAVVELHHAPCTRSSRAERCSLCRCVAQPPCACGKGRPCLHSQPRCPSSCLAANACVRIVVHVLYMPCSRFGYCDAKAGCWQRICVAVQALLDSGHVTVPAEIVPRCQAVLASRQPSADDTRQASVPACRRACAHRIKGITCFLGGGEVPYGTPAQSSCSRPSVWAAHIHVDGRPRWGCLRKTAAQAKQDRKELLAARKEGSLDDALAEMQLACCQRGSCQRGSCEVYSNGVKYTPQSHLDTWAAVGD
jgi:hypothetical protein